MGEDVNLEASVEWEEKRGNRENLDVSSLRRYLEKTEKYSVIQGGENVMTRSPHLGICS